MKKQKIKIILLAVLVIFFSISIVNKSFQNDTFFTIAIGQNILENGIENKEVLTWHENLEFTNVRWLFSVGIATIYNACGFIGIYIFTLIISAAIGCTIYFILLKKNVKHVISFFMTIYALYSVKNDICARAQIISALCFIIEYYCLEKLKETNEKKYWISLIIIPILIANIHTSIFPMYFIFFLPYFAEVIILKLPFVKIDDKKYNTDTKNIKSLFIVFVITIFTGLCTPLGLAAYTTLIKASIGLSTKFIAELQPIVLANSPEILLFVTIVIAFACFTKTKVNIRDLILILGLFLMSLSTYRSMQYLFLIGIIPAAKMINDFLENNGIFEYKISKLVQVIFFLVITIITVLYSIQKISYDYIYNDFVDSTKFPVAECEYIINNLNLDKIRIYNGFNYGSYLEFKGIPVFMDSRSEIYCKEFNDTTILEDYYGVYYEGKDFDELANKYDITHALIMIDGPENNKILQYNNWEEIFKGDMFILYERVK